MADEWWKYTLVGVSALVVGAVFGTMVGVVKASDIAATRLCSDGFTDLQTLHSTCPNVTGADIVEWLSKAQIQTK